MFSDKCESFEVVKFMTDIKSEPKHGQSGLDYNNYIISTLFNEKRNDIILNLVLMNYDSKILILTGLRDHAKFLCKKLKKFQISCEYTEYKDINSSPILISTILKTEMLYKFDFKYNMDLIILCYNSGCISQLFGHIHRMCDRLFLPKVISLVDNNFISIKNWNNDLKFYKDRECIITEETITPNAKNARFIPNCN